MRQTTQTPPKPPVWPIRERSKRGLLRHSLRRPWRLETGETYPVTIGTITTALEASWAR